MYLLCPSDEGCQHISRPWGKPLADFGVEEFVSLVKLFDGPNAPLGDAAAVAQARLRLKAGAGPVAVPPGIPPAVAQAVGERLVACTLHEVICEAAELAGLRDGLLHHRRNTSADEQRPHVLLLSYPGAGCGVNHRDRMGAKRRKGLLRDLVAGTWMDPANDDGADGCGPRKGPPSHAAAAAAAVPAGKKGGARRPHMAVVIAADGVGAAFDAAPRYYMTRPVGAEALRDRVDSTPPPPPVLGRATPVRPELGWILANLAHVRPGAVVLDPFVGTGSMLTPAIALGALHVLGLDIADNIECGGGADGVDAGAKGGGLFDAIICDPPYGLRKPRMLTGGEKDAPVQNAAEMQAAVAAAMAPVVNFAAGPAGLVPMGRLVFLFPSFDFTEAKGKGTRAAEADALKAAHVATVAATEGVPAVDYSIPPTDSACSAGSLNAPPAPTAVGVGNGVGNGGGDGSVLPPMVPGQDGYDALVAAVPRHPGLRLVCICAQEFKGMTRHAVVMAREGTT